MMNRAAAILLSLLCLSASAFAKVRTETVEYKQGDTMLEGFLVYDDAVKAGTKSPGIVVIHDWMDVGPYSKMRAEQLAQLGYIAFAADIYGKGVRPKNGEEAGRVAGRYKNDRALLRARAKAALDTLAANPRVDKSKLAAVGYCFGGTTVIELARSGADLSGVVSFHGGLDSPQPDDGKHIKCRVLALHGGNDPFVKAEDLAAFEQEMRQANVH
jgi:dienelactone hydrolase